jgi:hypothetical protein
VLELISDILEGLGTFNNTLVPNEELTNQLTEEREQAEIKSWKERIKQENIANGLRKYISIKQILIISVLYNIYLCTNSELFYFLVIDNTVDILSSVIPFWLMYRRKNKHSYIDSMLKSTPHLHKTSPANEELIIELLDDLNLKIKSKKIRQKIIENTILILNQIFVHYSIFPPREDPKFESIFSALARSHIEELLFDFFIDVGSYRIKNLALNIENQKVRKHLIKAVFTNYEKLIRSKSDRNTIMLTIRNELTRNNIEYSYKTNQNSTPSKTQIRKYHTSAHIIENNDKTNWKKLSLVITIILRLVVRTVSYVIMFNWIISHLEVSWKECSWWCFDLLPDWILLCKRLFYLLVLVLNIWYIIIFFNLCCLFW